MGRTLGMLAYGVAATVLVGASLYGLVRYVDSGVPAAPQQAAYVPPRPLRSATPAATPAFNPAPPSAMSENVVRTANKTWYLTPASPAQADVNTYNSLRSNCYANARGNSESEFPALQQAACERFAAFARSRGWDAGQLPGYGTPRPREAEGRVAVIGQDQPVDSGKCTTLYAEEQGVEAEMRAGYQEPRGNWLRARLRELEEQLWRLHCPAAVVGGNRGLSPIFGGFGLGWRLTGFRVNYELPKHISLIFPRLILRAKPCALSSTPTTLSLSP